ncbi:protein phosphatase type 1 complex subunit Hex2/Reg1 [Xylariaceae sp. FL0804]|nr:protein phosphatase type 1 complex subunit Hex2/Reg1 [Xylariaceae sp. FL0804]
MAVVISSEEAGLFSPALKRSHSQSNFVSKPSSSFRASSSTSHLNELFHKNYSHQESQAAPDTSPSSTPSSPRTLQVESTGPSYTSTPATSLSLDGPWEEDGRIQSEDLLMPDYDNNPFFGPLDDLDPPPTPRTGESYTASPADHETSPTASLPESPLPVEHAEDDTAVNPHPTHHVDYLSHNWKEEDIWSSWRYIVSNRGDYINGPRLENASWRTWMKAKYRLRTVSPETLNWLKDCDVTWLYGPLQTRHCKLFAHESGQGSSTLSRSNSFSHKKPILKKRSVSEIMLQRSLSSSSLLKQATAVVQAQQEDGAGRMNRPVLQRANTDYITYPFSSRRRSCENTSLLPSNATSGVISPSAERKRIHFDEQVTQCIAVDVKGDDDEEDEAYQFRWRFDDSDSDDGAIMMKKTTTRKRPVYLRKKTPVSANTESKTIAMLPSTTLKCRDSSPASPDTAARSSTGALKSPLLSPSPSQETLRPAKRSGAFFVGDEDDEDFDSSDANPTPNTSPIEPSSYFRQSNLQRSVSTNSLTSEPAGMRRTDSGMFMPYEEGGVQPNDGIFGRVIDTVNTARDIAHVIWNVGWRR